MTARIDRVNRALLIVIGLALVIVGVLILLQSGGLFGDKRTESPVVSDPTARWYSTNSSWFWPVVGVLMLLVAGLCVWWVSAQLRIAGSPRIELVRAHNGTVTTSGTALADCVELDALAQEGISRARAKLTSVGEEVRLHLTIWVEPPYDVATAVTRITNTALPHLAYAFECPTPKLLRTTIHVETAEATVARLR